MWFGVYLHRARLQATLSIRSCARAKQNSPGSKSCLINITVNLLLLYKDRNCSCVRSPPALECCVTRVGRMAVCAHVPSQPLHLCFPVWGKRGPRKIGPGIPLSQGASRMPCSLAFTLFKNVINQTGL